MILMMPPLELKRQLLHIVFGLALVALLYYNILTTMMLLGLTVLGIILSYILKYRRVPVISSLLEQCERSEDLKTYPGRAVIHYALGCLLALTFFEKDAALAGMMILALGDSVSHIVGRFYGRIKHPLNAKKLVEGWLAGILAGFLGAWLFVSVSWWEALAASFIAMTLETVEWSVDKRILDDNLFIPVVGAIVISLARMIV